MGFSMSHPTQERCPMRNGFIARNFNFSLHTRDRLYKFASHRYYPLSHQFIDLINQIDTTPNRMSLTKRFRYRLSISLLKVRPQFFDSLLQKSKSVKN